MYKTVRKGDASLQYTILPQTDQFNSNGPPPSPPPPSGMCHMILYKLVIAVVVIAICVCGIVAFMTTVYVTRSNHDPYYVITMSRNGHSNAALKLNDSQQALGINSDGKSPEEQINSTKALFEVSMMPETTEIMETKTYDNFVDHNTEEIDTLGDFASSESNIVITEEVNPVPTEEVLSSESSEAITALPTTLETPSSTSFENPQPSILSESSTTWATPTSAFKKAKMPRVTLKLRENETIPQMYMKAGIATYKKGNITTSVLAHGLSLEGLIFRTPQGTIKPWNAKWSFVDNSSPYSQWKGYSDIREQIFAVLVTLMAVSVVIICVLTLTQLKASRRRWHNVEEPPLAGRDEEEQEDRSKLLDSTSKDGSDEKE